jgi:TRAP-type transport system small permease protein
MTSPVRQLLKALAHLAAWGCGLSFLAIFVVNITAVAGRYTGYYSLLWAPDLTRLLFIWLVFTGAAAATRSQSHLAIDFLRDLLPEGAQRLVTTLVHLLFLVLLAVLIVQGWRYGLLRMNIPYTQLGVAQGWAYLALPVGSTLMTLFTLEALVDHWRVLRHEPTTAGEE